MGYVDKRFAPTPESNVNARDTAATLRFYSSSVPGMLSVVATELGGRGYLAGSRLNVEQVADLRALCDEFLQAQPALAGA